MNQTRPANRGKNEPPGRTERKPASRLTALTGTRKDGDCRTDTAHVFFNRGRDKVKILWYDRHGWWLMYKRLERGRFATVSAGELSEADLRLVLEGVDLSVRRLKPVRFERVA